MRFLLFTGRELILNHVVRTGGRVRVELQDAGRRPYDGFSLADCTPLDGDAIEAPVAWKGARDVSALAGKPLRLRFEIRDADVYSFRFR